MYSAGSGVEAIVRISVRSAGESPLCVVPEAEPSAAAEESTGTDIAIHGLLTTFLVKTFNEVVFLGTGLDISQPMVDQNSQKNWEMKSDIQTPLVEKVVSNVIIHVFERGLSASGLRVCEDLSKKRCICELLAILRSWNRLAVMQKQEAVARERQRVNAILVQKHIRGHLLRKKVAQKWKMSQELLASVRVKNAEVLESLKTKAALDRERLRTDEGRREKGLTVAYAMVNHHLRSTASIPGVLQSRSTPWPGLSMDQLVKHLVYLPSERVRFRKPPARHADYSCMFRQMTRIDGSFRRLRFGLDPPPTSACSILPFHDNSTNPF